MCTVIFQTYGLPFEKTLCKRKFDRNDLLLPETKAVFILKAQTSIDIFLKFHNFEYLPCGLQRILRGQRLSLNGRKRVELETSDST